MKAHKTLSDNQSRAGEKAARLFRVRLRKEDKEVELFTAPETRDMHEEEPGERFVVVKEFVQALFAGETYNPRRNPYVIFGLLWGLPVPVLGLLIEWHVSRLLGHPVSLFRLLGEPFLLFLFLHPPIFAMVFGAMGTVRLRKIEHIKQLLAKNIEEKEALQKAHTELKNLSRIRDEFLSNVTHELKTPLVTVSGYTNMLLAGKLGELSDRQKRALSVVQKNCVRLAKQIDMLLAASRNLIQIPKLKRTKIDLAGLLAEVKEQHKITAQQKGVTLRCEFPPEPVTLWGDRERLREVLDNLLSNAIKFTDPGGSVVLSFGRPQGDRLSAEIVDTGCGIPPEALPYIFERFRQADGSIRRRYGGSGLGLAIVKTNLEAHDCSISVESEVGRGTRFTFELPVYTENCTESEPGR